MGVEYQATKVQCDLAWAIANDRKFIPRGNHDGNPTERYAVILGQIMVADVLEVERPTGFGNFDGGVDFFISGKVIDLKTIARNTPFFRYMNGLVMESQYLSNKKTDVYLFASINRRERILTIVGWIKKFDIRRDQLRAEGTTELLWRKYPVTYSSDTYSILTNAMVPWKGPEDFIFQMSMFG